MAAHAACAHHTTHVFEMMQRLGIETGAGVVPRLGLSYSTALHRCETCGCKQPCRDWLDSMPQAVAFAPRFCPNADILFELQVDEPGLHRSASGKGADRFGANHAYISDLERLQGEIDEVLLLRPAEDSARDDLTRRRMGLRERITSLRRQDGIKRRAS